MSLPAVSLSMLSTLMGGDSSLLGGQQAKATSGAPPLVMLKLADKNRSKGIADTAKQPEVLRDITSFRKAIATAKDAKALAGDARFLKVLLTANGLADSVNYPGLAQKVLMSDPADRKATVNRIADTRWASVVKTFQMGTKGLAIVSDPKVQQTLVDGYAEITWRKSLDETTPGLSDALTFRAKAATVTSAVQILGDAVLRRVVTKALGIPQEIAFQELPAQEKAINSRLDIKRLSVPKFVDALSQQYLLAMQGSNTSSLSPSLDTLAAKSRGLMV